MRVAFVWTFIGGTQSILILSGRIAAFLRFPFGSLKSYNLLANVNSHQMFDLYTNSCQWQLRQG